MTLPLWRELQLEKAAYSDDPHEITKRSCMIPFPVPDHPDELILGLDTKPITTALLRVTAQGNYEILEDPDLLPHPVYLARKRFRVLDEQDFSDRANHIRNHRHDTTLYKNSLITICPEKIAANIQWSDATPIREIFEKWAKNLNEDTRKSLKRYNQITEQCFRIPHLWCQQISQSKALYQWFTRYPTALMYVTDSAIFQDIEEGQSDVAILKKIQNHIEKDLTPAERKANAKREKEWHLTLRNILELHQLPPSLMSGNKNKNRIIHIAKECDQRASCFDKGTGKTLDPFQYAFRILTAPPALIIPSGIHLKDPSSLGPLLMKNWNSCDSAKAQAYLREFLPECEDLMQMFSVVGISYFLRDIKSKDLIKLVDDWKSGLGAEINRMLFELEQQLSGNTVNPTWISPAIPDHENFTFTRLQSRQELFEEGNNMNHCIGSYYIDATEPENHSHLYHVESEIYDPMTLEMSESFAIKALLGKNNHTPPQAATQTIKKHLKDCPRPDKESQKRMLESRTTAKQLIEDQPKISLEARKQARLQVRDHILRRYPHVA